jgi:glycosyltransferase involved in cell wall biosynthesis
MAYEVTIGIPVYNAEKYIRKAINSALAQTFENIEFLILDDCCTDDSMTIVCEFQNTHYRGKDIHIISQPKNMGIGNARNRIVGEAQGKYLFFMDADDVISPKTIELLCCNANRYDAELVYGSHERVEKFNGKINIFKCQYRDRKFFKEDEFANWVYRQYDGIQATTWNILININIYRKYGLEYPATNYWEDFSFTMDLPLYVKRVVMLSDITYYYNCRSESLSNFSKRDYIEKSEIQAVLDAMFIVKQNTDRVKSKPYFHQRMYKVMMTHFYMVCAILRNEKIIHPLFTKHEIRDVMRSPLSFSETLKLKGWRFKNMFLYFLGELPSSVTVSIIRIFGKIKGLI